MIAQNLIAPTGENETGCVCGKSVKDHWFGHFPGTDGWLSLCSPRCAFLFLELPAANRNRNASNEYSRSQRRQGAQPPRQCLVQLLYEGNAPQLKNLRGRS
jgi:hypothetical protein